LVLPVSVVMVGQASVVMWKLSEKHKEKCYSLPDITAGNTSEAHIPLPPSSVAIRLPTRSDTPHVK
jgi:hypothetical protein